MVREVTPTAPIAAPRAACCADRVTVGRWLIAIAWSVCCPGAGQALADRRRAAIAWAAAALVAVLAIPATISHAGDL
jgi:hypothetical protein